MLYLAAPIVLTSCVPTSRVLQRGWDGFRTRDEKESPVSSFSEPAVTGLYIHVKVVLVHGEVNRRHRRLCGVVSSRRVTPPISPFPASQQRESSSSSPSVLHLLYVLDAKGLECIASSLMIYDLYEPSRIFRRHPLFNRINQCVVSLGEYECPEFMRML